MRYLTLEEILELSGRSFKSKAKGDRITPKQAIATLTHHQHTIVIPN